MKSRPMHRAGSIDAGRRSLLGAAVAGCAGLVSQPANALGLSLSLFAPTTRETHRVVVIGSGFGGGVAALRLAQAGVRVLVLERGRRWPTGPNADTFPTVQTVDERAVWYGTIPTVLGQRVVGGPYAGLLEAVASPTMTALCAAGVGGGSLVYQGMTLQPAEAVFNSCLPEALDWKRMDREHYPRVARMLGAATAPDSIINSPTYFPSRVFKRNCERVGFTVDKIPMPIDWSWAERELRGEMKPAYTNGDCALGVNNGGKHSVDVTYLAQAEATGNATVAPLHNVRRIARARDGKWKVYVDRTDDNGRLLEHKEITITALFLCAGAINSTELLMRARACGDISNLPDAVGTGYGTNADRIYAWTSFEEDFGPVQGGPVVYGSKEWDNPALANTLTQAAIPPVFGFDPHSTMIVGFGVSAARGKWIYNPLTDDTQLIWQLEGDAVAQARIAQRIKAVAGPSGLLVDTNAVAPTTWHSLGGAAMSAVCDLEGRVREQRGLYVLDGALIPGNTAACNPSMTIAAVAERAMDDIVVRDIGTLI